MYQIGDEKRTYYKLTLWFLELKKNVEENFLFQDMNNSKFLCKHTLDIHSSY